MILQLVFINIKIEKYKNVNHLLQQGKLKNVVNSIIGKSKGM